MFPDLLGGDGEFPMWVCTAKARDPCHVSTVERGNPYSDLRSFDAQWTEDDLEGYAASLFEEADCDAGVL
jgi:hypothetical protein